MNDHDEGLTLGEFLSGKHLGECVRCHQVKRLIEGRCRHCDIIAARMALVVAMGRLRRDLKRRFGGHS